MILENISITDIAAQSIDRTVTALVHHLKDRGAALGGRREEASAQRMTCSTVSVLMICLIF
jgi:hypothetical protein